jgi:hypothetical protein
LQRAGKNRPPLNAQIVSRTEVLFVTRNVLGFAFSFVTPIRRFGVETVRTRFGSWNKALKRAGLTGV